MSAEDEEEAAERRAIDVEVGFSPAQRSFHAVLHGGLAPGGMHGEIEVSHDCRGDWIDDHDWSRIPEALVKAGWTAPAPADAIVGDTWVERPDRPTLDVLARWHNDLAANPGARERVMADIAHILGQAQAEAR